MISVKSPGMEGQPPSSDVLGSASAPTQFTNPAPDKAAGTTAELNAQPDIAFDPNTLAEPQAAATVQRGEIGNSPVKPDPGTLLSAMWRSPGLVHQIGILDRATACFQNMPVTSVSDAMRAASAASKAGHETYYACSEYHTIGSRKSSNAAGAYGFWVDVDVSELKAAAGKGYKDIDDAKLALAKFCQQADLPMPTHIAESGAGVHAYWVLSAFLNREEWTEYAGKFKALTHEFGVLVDDSRTSDIASVLRIPGTLNHKYDPPREVTLVQAAETYIDMGEMLAAIDDAHGKLVKPVQAKPVQPKPISAVNAARVEGLSFGPPDVKRLASALAVLEPDCDEREWKFEIIAPLARAARDYPKVAEELKQLAISFSSGALRGTPSLAWVTPGATNKLTGEQALEGQWQRFLNEPPSDESRTGLGTIFHNAELAGWLDPAKLFRGVADAAQITDTSAVGSAGVPASAPASQKATNKQAGSAPAPSALLLDLQVRYALLNMSGKICLLDRECLTALASDGAAKKLVLSNLGDGTLLLQRMARLLHPADAAAKAQIQEFFVSPGTTCYDGIEFNPAGTSNNYLNLWVGPTVKPTPGLWLLIQEFVLNVICSSHQGQYDYLIRLIAHALQHPSVKPGILVILIGGQGVGKGTLGRILRKIWSATYLQVNRVAAITGEFNSALERAFIVVMDEALFAGDHRASDALKSLTTEEVIHINEKHQPARQIASYHRFFIFTNADHVKSTDRDDRRDFTLRVSEARKGDHEYWTALDREIQGGGVAAMVHDLLAMDLSGFNVRAKPNTQELVAQKLHSLTAIPRWWYDALYRAELGGESDWPDFITTENIIRGVLELSGKKLHRNPSAMDVIQAMGKLCPSATKGQKQNTLNTRQRGLLIPALDLARAEFELYIGGTVQWEPEQEQEAPGHGLTDGDDGF